MVNQLYKTGTTNSVKKVDEIIPPMIVQPSGDQRLQFYGAWAGLSSQ
ncbi:MAG: hypothetical protein RIF33_15715 [Cyclobacteriaceae bacterium]